MEGERQALADALGASLDGPIPVGTDRQIPGVVRFAGKATAIVGARRAGKSTYVHQRRRERLAAGTPRALLPHINFEDERFAELDARSLGFLTEEYARRVPDAASLGVVSWSFDEIQLVRGWERFVRRLLDAGSEITLTGSSAALLSREIGTALRGRAWTVPLFPFSFAESLAHEGHSVPPDPGSLPPGARGKLERQFGRWLDAGGFPEAQGLASPERRQLLRDYVDVAMLRDVVERHSVSNVTGLRWLVRHLLGNAAAHFSVEKFHRALKAQGIAVSRDTLHLLVAYLEDCFLVRTVWIEADSERQRMVNPRKAYPVDTGLIPVFDRTGRANVGHALESAVLIELERRRCEVTYVRTDDGHEVDFLARDSRGDLHLIQVCADAHNDATAAREIRALETATRRWPHAARWLLTVTRDALPAVIPKGITACPAYQWMLEAWDER